MFNETLKSGFKWIISAQITLQLFRIIRLILLLQFINPQDFGIFTLALIFVQLSSLITGDNVEAAIIQEDDLTRNKLNTVFWLTVIISTIVTILYLVVAPIFLVVLNLEDYHLLFIWLIIIFGVESISRVSRGLLRKNLKFKFLAQTDIMAFSLNMFVSLTLAYLDFGVFSLLGGLATGYIFTATICIYKADWYPSVSFDRENLSILYDFSKNVTLFRLLTWGMRYIDDLIIGLFYGKSELGIYDRAYTFAHLPVRLVSNRLNEALLPSYVQKSENRKRTNAHFHLNLVKLSILFYIPIWGFVFLFSDYIIRIFLDDSWYELSWFIPVLTFGGIIHALLNFNESIFLATGKSRLQLYFGILTRGIIVIAYVIGAFFSVKGIALAYSIGSAIAFFPETKAALKELSLNFSDLQKDNLNVIISTLAFTILIYLFQRLFPEYNILYILIYISAGYFYIKKSLVRGLY